MPSHPDNADDSLNDPSTLRAAWLNSGGTDTEFLARGRMDLDSYETDKLMGAKIEIESCQKFLERAKGVLGVQAFAVLCGEEAIRAQERATKGRSYSGAKPKKSTTAMFIGLVRFRVSKAAEEWASGKKPTNEVTTPSPKKTSLKPTAPPEAEAIADPEMTPKKLVRAKKKLESSYEIQKSSANERDALIWSSVTMCQASLPHTDPGEENVWTRVNGTQVLLIEAGHTTDHLGAKKFAGLPYGPIPRLLLHYITDQVYTTRSRRVSLGRSMYAFLTKLGLSDSAQNYASVKDQLNRLTNASFKMITHFQHVGKSGKISYGEKGKVAPPIASDWSFWWSDKPNKDPLQEDLFDSYLILSQDYFNDLLSSCLPLDIDVLKHLRKSSFQLDLYAWLTYRVFRLSKLELKEIRPIPYKTLQEQLGSTTKESKEFKYALGKHLRVIESVWRGKLDYELSADGLIIRESAVQIAPPPPKKSLPPPETT